jgi:3-oxoacyl-[acyl-carrier protein] reductase
MSKLNGKVAVVTGASKGIGAAIAIELGATGTSVVVNYASNRDAAERAVKQIVDGGGEAIALQGDVSKAADVERLFAAAQSEYGRLDIPVNNVGVFRSSL